MYESISSFFKKNHNELIETNQRLTVVFHASNNDAEVLNFISELGYKNKLIISPLIKNALAPSNAASKLGEEYDLVFYDARETFNPDTLGIVSGVLCGGGILFLLLPSYKKWISHNSLFFKHLSSLLTKQSGVYYFKNDNTEHKALILNNKGLSQRVACTQVNSYKAEDQRIAVETIVSLLNINKQQCCVLTSGRGRGKSSALGFISNELLKNESYKILISAPKLSVAAPLFYHLQQQCPQGVLKKSEFIYKQSSLKFIAPDMLLEKQPAADVLLIDEAAVIPLFMLRKLLSCYSKIIFSTTTHGYEGTGRGFVLKFYQLLDAERPSWKKIELHQPIRWSKNDFLEKWIESILFLNVKLPVKPVIPKHFNQCDLKLIDREMMLNDKNKMAEIFSLLVFAHYRTSPSDFQYLLDSEHVRIYSLEFENKSLAVLVINQEGGFEPALSTAVYRGERRPKGNLLAQTLCFHGGCEAAAELLYARVMRIAVHPENQQRGLGSYLLKQVIESEQARGMDVLGSSFSATPKLLNFWHKADLSLLRMGFSRDHVSASHSAVMALPLTQNANKTIAELKVRFKQNILLWLQGPLLGLSDNIKQHHLFQPVEAISHPDDIKDVESFAKFNRNYDACMPAIMRFIRIMYKQLDGLGDNDKNIILLSEKYMNNWKLIIENSSSNSKSQAIKNLRSALNNLLLINQ